MSQDRITPIPPVTTHFGREPDETVHDIRTHQLVTRADFDVFRKEFSAHREEMDDWRMSVASDISQMREAMQGIAKHVLVPATIPPPAPHTTAPTNMPGVMRDRLPSIVDEAMLEKLPPAPNGQPRYAMTSGEMRAVVDQSVVAKLGIAVSEAIKQKERDDKAALVDDVRGRAKGVAWGMTAMGLLSLAGYLWAKLVGWLK